jgi:hypothetical protein
MRVSLRRLAFVMLASTAAGSAALGSATVDSDFPTPAGSLFRYPYGISIAAGDTIHPGDFFRIYDFYGWAAAQPPTDWSVSLSLSDPTPPPNVLLSYGDDPVAYNLTFTYIGTTDITGPTSITGFSADGPTPSYVLKDGAARVTNASTGNPVDSVNAVVVPAPLPEPASLGVIALAGAAAVLRRRHGGG